MLQPLLADSNSRSGQAVDRIVSKTRARHASAETEPATLNPKRFGCRVWGFGSGRVATCWKSRFRCAYLPFSPKLGSRVWGYRA